MFLLLGDFDDPVCTAVLASLKARGCEARIVGNPILAPLRFTWRFDTLKSACQLVLEDGMQLSNSEIEGVLVRRPADVSSDGWNQDDLAYVQSETHAVVLAWLWSLDCPVVNRYPAALWHRLDAPLLFWRPQLERCGLHTLPSLISNVELETRAFGAVLGNEIVYAPLTIAARYPLDCDGHLTKLAAMLRLGPVHLTQASKALRSACVVGSRVVWDGPVPADADVLEPALSRFAAAAGLTFVEITMTSIADGAHVTAVNAFPCLERFGQVSRHQILAGLVQLLIRDLQSTQMDTHICP
jgi:hypothetical protein